MDSMTYVQASIEYEHKEIHEGNHFFYEDYAALAQDAAIDFGIYTPDGKTWTHIVWEIVSTLGMTVQMYEDANITWDGTDLTAFNNNRNHSKENNWMQFQSDPTVNNVGTLLAERQIGSASNPNLGLPGDGGRNREIILKKNTIYLWRLTSLNNANIISYLAEWYNHTNK
jgi:hypothetical protein